jgi:ubiquinone/menaquinone biosynthesis C-methylase UbiE
MTAPANWTLRERTYALQRDALAGRVFRALRSRGLAPEGLTIADIGCGKGLWLRKFSEWGVTAAGLYGLDVDPFRVAAARRLLPEACLVRADCQAIPFRSASFDVVTQFTLFTSLEDSACRQAAAREMLRLVRPGGWMIWHDFFAPNPLNPKTRPVRGAEIRELFPGCEIFLERSTLVAPLARLVMRLSWPPAEALDRVRWLQTHYLGLIRRKTPHD